MWEAPPQISKTCMIRKADCVTTVAAHSERGLKTTGLSETGKRISLVQLGWDDRRMLLFSPCFGGGIMSADLLSSYYLNCRREFCGKSFNMVIHYHYYNCLYTEETPCSCCASGAVSLQASSNTQHKGPAVNQRTRDPGPVLAERELSLRGEGFGSRPWPSETSRVGLAPHSPVCRKL